MHIWLQSWSNRPTGQPMKSNVDLQVYCSFGYMNNSVIRPLIYFNSHMGIDKHIIHISFKLIHVFMQDHGTNKHKNARIVS